MTPEQWSQVFSAGWQAIPSAGTPAADALARALAAMARVAQEIAEAEDA